MNSEVWGLDASAEEGRVAHDDEWVVVGDHFEQRESRIFVNADGRVYKFKRD